jgi:hypothetical protein
VRLGLIRSESVEKASEVVRRPLGRHIRIMKEATYSYGEKRYLTRPIEMNHVSDDA